MHTFLLLQIYECVFSARVETMHNGCTPDYPGHFWLKLFSSASISDDNNNQRKFVELRIHTLGGSNKLSAHYIRLLCVVFKSALNRIPPFLGSARTSALNNTLDGREKRKKGIILTDFDCVTECGEEFFGICSSRRSEFLPCALSRKVPLMKSSSDSIRDRLLSLFLRTLSI